MPLADALRAPVVTRFTMNVPVPWKLVSGIAIPVGIVMTLLILRFRRSSGIPRPNR